MALSSIPLAVHPPPLTLIALLDVIVMVPIFLAAAVAVAVAVVVVVDVVIVKRFLGLIYEAGQAAYLAAQLSSISPPLHHTRQAALLAVMGVRLQ